MIRPSSLEIELIQKITRASIKIEALKREHSDTCPMNDPEMVGKCICGVSEYNQKVNDVLLALKIE